MEKLKFYDFNEEIKQKAEEVLDGDQKLVTEFWREKLEKEAGKNWDTFYKHNQANFFKDRHYILKEFSELQEAAKYGECLLLDVGCGVGNAFFPLCAELPSLKVNAFDFAKTAVDLIPSHSEFDPE